MLNADECGKGVTDGDQDTGRRCRAQNKARPTQKEAHRDHPVPQAEGKESRITHLDLITIALASMTV